MTDLVIFYGSIFTGVNFLLWILIPYLIDKNSAYFDDVEAKDTYYSFVKVTVCALFFIFSMNFMYAYLRLPEPKSEIITVEGTITFFR